MLKGEKVRIRAIEPSDIDLLYEWENNTDVWRISDSNAPFSRYILEQYVHTVPDIYVQRQMRAIVTLRANSSKPLGCIDLFDFEPHHRRIGLGILIAEHDNRGIGYGTEAIQLVLNYCFNFLDCHQVYCNVAADNPASLRVFNKLGFEHVGIKKDWIRYNGTFADEVMLQKINHRE